MIARTPWLRRRRYRWNSSSWNPLRGRMPVCDSGLRQYVRIPRGTKRLRICASDRRPREDRDVFEVRRPGPDPIGSVRWVTVGDYPLVMLPSALAWWLVEKFPRYRSLHVWVEVE